MQWNLMFYGIEQGYFMSYTQISNDILYHIADLKLTPYDFTVYAVLRMHDYGKGYAYPSVRTIAKITIGGLDFHKKRTKP
jgi:hypothetical protein